MNTIPIIAREDFLARLDAARRPFHDAYDAMYSSVLGGIVTDPVLMLIPVDDHMAHRGDGVFETFKCVDGGLYNLRAHLRRLHVCAERIALAPPISEEDLIGIVARTVRTGGRRDALVRLFLSRGPGSLGVNPYDCPRPQVYVVSGRLPPPFMTSHPGGARAARSAVGVKGDGWATIKSVNYLSNVLMKKEAVDRGVDFVLAFDASGCLAEGATENAGIVTRDNLLVIPRPDHILMGTTMLRALELAGALVADGVLTGIEQGDISLDDIAAAREMLIFGTTPDVTAVVEFEGRPVGAGRPGPVYDRLGPMLARDIRANAALRVPVFDDPNRSPRNPPE